MNKNILIVLVGPTGIGKTELGIRLAEHFGCDILSSDSRQVFKELKIGTATPDEDQLSRVKHHFIATKSIFDYYSAGQYELDALSLLEDLFQKNTVQIMVGGSMLYVDAVCNGLDDIPVVSSSIRDEVNGVFEKEGIEAVQNMLQKLDPVSYARIDLSNKQRVMHAVEVSMSAQKPYSELLGRDKASRPFNIIKIGLNMPRDILYQRINSRVDIMIEQGLLEEVKGLYEHKDLNSLNTVGYKELFNYFDGEYTYDFAVNMIKQNSRRYAKRQLTWFKRDEKIKWFHPAEFSEIVAFVESEIKI